MKSKILLFVLLITSMSCPAQNIIYDTLIEGERKVETSVITYLDNKVGLSWNFGLIGYHADGADEITYFIILNIISSHPIEYRNVAPMRVKTFDDCTFTTIGHGKQTNSFYKDGSTYYRNITYHPMVGDMLDSLACGIKKIRVMTAGGYVECEFKKDKVGKRLYESYVNIRERMGAKAPSFADDF